MIHIALNRSDAVCGDSVEGDWITVKSVIREIVGDNVDGMDSLPDDLCDNCMKAMHSSMGKLRRVKGWIK